MDGSPPTMNRAYAIRVTGQQTLDAVIAAQKANGLDEIEPRYFVATCFHEAGCSNEWDTEIASPSCTDGFVSVGAYQIGKEEAARYSYQLSDMLDFAKATDCMIRLAHDNLSYIQHYVSQFPNANTNLDYTDEHGVFWKDGALRAYLAICHNKGAGYTRKTIAAYGLNWPAYKQRNPQDNIVAHGYGEDCVTGGPFYPGSKPVPQPMQRTLSLTHPFMTGEDVKELQRHLSITPDGVFGPGTETALINYQKSQGLKPDGVCGPVTWAALLTTP